MENDNNKDEKLYFVEKQAMKDQHTAGVVCFWVGLFIFGIILEPLAIHYFNREADIASENGILLGTSNGVYKTIAIILVVLQIVWLLLTLLAVAAATSSVM